MLFVAAMSTSLPALGTSDGPGTSETGGAAPGAFQAAATPPARNGSDWLRHDFQNALAHGQLGVAYQPRVCLDTRRIVGAEALARWPHRRHGMVPPAQFIPVAEQTGMVVPLGGWMLQAACSEAARWPANLTVSVNASACQLAKGVLLGQVRSALDLSGLAPERLEIELTESMLVDATIETLLILSEIRDLGVGLALDDFGTGYAGLATVRRLPLTTLKLDRSFVRGVLRYREDTAIAQAVITFGATLGLAIVAEGVEDEAQCRFLASLGCQEGQAFFFGRPASAERFREMSRNVVDPGAEGQPRC